MIAPEPRDPGLVTQTPTRCAACRRPVRLVQAAGRTATAEAYPPVQVRWSRTLGSLFLWFHPHKCRPKNQELNVTDK